jgi:hypothetical protein
MRLRFAAADGRFQALRRVRISTTRWPWRISYWGTSIVIEATSSAPVTSIKMRFATGTVTRWASPKNLRGLERRATRQFL